MFLSSDFHSILLVFSVPHIPSPLSPSYLLLLTINHFVTPVLKTTVNIFLFPCLLMRFIFMLCSFYVCSCNLHLCKVLLQTFSKWESCYIWASPDLNHHSSVQTRPNRALRTSYELGHSSRQRSELKLCHLEGWGKNTAATVHANSRRSHMLLSSTLYVSPPFSCSLGVKTTKESRWPVWRSLLDQ